MDSETEHPSFYHIGFGRGNLGDDPPTLALLCGDPGRAAWIARDYLSESRTLSENRGLHSYLGRLRNGRPVVAATSGMGAPSTSIVVNELVQTGLSAVIRIGTCGSIQPNVHVGSVVVTSAALTRQGAAFDVAPPGFPAAADPFLTVALAEAARRLDVDHHVGLTASVDTFFEGQGRSESSANPHLLPHLVDLPDQLARLNVLNFEMEAATLFVMGQVYGFTAGCVCAVVAERTEDEHVDRESKARAVDSAIRVALEAAEHFA